ncbi:MAG: CAF17-like 4Fe-4S cluster assembly/insertion protein YgfZ [Gemmatimonadaceae bacterium]
MNPIDQADSGERVPGNVATSTLDLVQTRAYRALQDHAAVVDRSARMRMSLTGDKAKEALGGLLTNDVASLTKGAGQRAAALTPKGRVIALVRVFDRGDDLLVDADAAAGAGFIAMIRKFVNPRLARHTELTAATGCLGVYGPEAARQLAPLLGTGVETLAELPPMGSITVGSTDDAMLVVRSTDLGVPGYDCIAAVDRISRLDDQLGAAGIARADATVATVARMEAGRPKWGVEMDDETIPQEANLDAFGAISFNKGCYTGQEVVARIHFRGHVNRHLRWLTAAEPLAAGSAVQDATGREVGTVRSSVVSPQRGPLAIAMLRREVAPGDEVTVLADGREIRARCAEISYK